MKDLGNFNGLKKAAIFTDIHWGKRGEIHNKDCMDFVQFFCNYCCDPSNGIDHIVFTGDWFDKRDSINISTLNYSYKALDQLNALNLPILLLLGNHDLYLRNTREVNSLVYFQEFKNVHLIETPTRLTIDQKNVLLLPYLFHDEYVPLSADVNSSELVFGHLELKGFVLTGSSILSEHGYDPDLFNGPKRIFSGHFHKRQNKNNVYYTGNPFPFDFSDTNDTERGFAVYDYQNDTLTFHDHLESPSYIKCSLTNLLTKHKTILKEKGVVRCLVDADISMEESIALREKFIETYKLREFTFEETSEDITQSAPAGEDEDNFETTGEMIRSLLERIETEKLRKEKIIEIYEKL